MAETEKINWTAPEYEEKERSKDWFWALGVVIVAGSAASIIFGNYFFAILLVLGGISLGLLAVKKPDIVSYELGEKGLKIGTELYPYENIKSFWVQDSPKPLLFVKSRRIFMPIISAPIEGFQTERVRNLLLAKNVPEEEMKEHLSDKIMEKLGF